MYREADLLASKPKIDAAFKAYIAKIKLGDETYYPLILAIDDEAQAALNIVKRDKP